MYWEEKELDDIYNSALKECDGGIDYDELYYNRVIFEKGIQYCMEYIISNKMNITVESAPLDKKWRVKSN